MSGCTSKPDALFDLECNENHHRFCKSCLQEYIKEKSSSKIIMKIGDNEQEYKKTKDNPP